MSFFDEQEYAAVCRAERVKDLDATINRNFRALDMMREAGRQNSPEYEVLLLSIRSQTAERLKLLGLRSESLEAGGAK